MDKADILALLNEVLPELLKPTTETLLADVKTFMSESVDPLVDRVEALSKAPTPAKEETKEAPTTEGNDPLSARVKLLEAQIEAANKAKAEQDAIATDLRFNQSLSAELDKVNPLHKATVTELLATRLRKEAQEKDGSWLTKDGKNLSETVQDFFKSPEGLHFLPSTHVNGVGATESKAPKTGDKLDLESALLAAFS